MVVASQTDSLAAALSFSVFRSAKLPLAAAGLAFIALAFSVRATAQEGTIPNFTNVTVHDPSAIKADSKFYVFGSHLASASSPDLIHWTQISTTEDVGNALVPNPPVEFADALAWVGSSSSFWAPDVIRLADGRYYYYYCVGDLSSPRAALGLAVSKSITGPYKNLGIMLESGMWGLPSPDGRIYDPTIHPNTVDPSVFFDQTGKLWMVYGSYSGGIFIIQLNPATGMLLPGQGYGKKLIGGNHVRVEGSYIFYSPESGYYYLTMTFGGFTSDGGYNIRMARSRNPDGPYFDAAGNDLTNVAGPAGTLFDDDAIAPYGVKLMGNYQFLHSEGEPSQVSRGYLSPGGTSINFDAATHRTFLFFHTRFVGRGEEHEVRVHQLFMNTDGWLVAAPQRYAGETLSATDASRVAGNYKFINHGKAISAAVNFSTLITLRPDYTISGAATGTWALTGDHDATLTIDGTVYHGVFVDVWDDDNGVWVNAFSALSGDGTAVWGSKVAISNTPTLTINLGNRSVLYGHSLNFAVPRPAADPSEKYTYNLAEGPSGMSIDRVTGVLTWTPLLSQIDQPFPVTVRVANISTDPVQTVYTFSLSAISPTIVNRLDLDFSSAGSTGIRDASGQSTGFTTRLAGTGSALPALDPNLALDPSTGILALTTTQADFNGRAGLASNSSPGVSLSSLGFTGAEDFVATVVIRPLPTLDFIDQVGLYVGASSDAVTRAGTIVFATPERYSTHSQGGVDASGHFFGGGFDGSDGMTVTITRQAGTWRYFVDGVEWNPEAAGVKVEPSFLNARADLTAGVFAITPLNSNRKTIQIDSFSLAVATSTSRLSALEQWRVNNFAQLTNDGSAANTADPDGDGLSNLFEYATGGNPAVSDANIVGPKLGMSVAPQRLTLTFNRVADPNLIYTVEASSDPRSGFSPIWTSSGPANTAGTVTVPDIVTIADAPSGRFLRLRISTP